MLDGFPRAPSPPSESTHLCGDSTDFAGSKVEVAVCQGGLVPCRAISWLPVLCKALPCRAMTYFCMSWRVIVIPCHDVSRFLFSFSGKSTPGLSGSSDRLTDVLKAAFLFLENGPCDLSSLVP